MEFIQELDFTILNLIYENLRNNFMNIIMPIITILGD